MKNGHLILLIAVLCFLTGCTSINKKCDYVPSGGCWKDGRECSKDPDPAPCRNVWSCGYNYSFHDQ